jgi:CubicO group peptidase (beta-lactamase class C family)
MVRSRFLPAFLSGLCAAVVSLLATGPASAQHPTVSLANVEAFADSFFVRYLHDYPSPSLALVIVSGDSILLMKGYGTEDGRRPVDPRSTVFNMASLSKLVVATAAVQLVEHGAVALDDDIEPMLGDVRIIGDGPPVALRHLLTHTSGLEGPFLREVVADPGQLVPLRSYFGAHPPRRGRSPGREARYSNYAMALAGYLIERVSGESSDAYAERHVFAPLGMTSSSFRQPPPEPLAERIATAGAGRVPDAILLYPAGSLVSTPADIARLMVAHLNGGRFGAQHVLSEGGVRLMHTRQWSADPRVPGVGLGFFESTLGGEPALFHTGARVHYSLLCLFPRRGVGIFIVHSMRQGGEFQTLRTDFLRAFVAHYFPNPPQPLLDGAGATERAHALAGFYRPHLLPITTIERAAGLFSDTRVRVGPDSRLQLRIPAGPPLTLVEQEEDLYRVAGGVEEGLMIAFARDSTGRIRHMSMSGNTQDPIVFDRLVWYQRGTLHALLLAVVFLLFIGCAVAGLLGGIVRRVRRRRRSVEPAAARRAWGAAVTAGLLFAATPVSVAAIVLAHRGDDAAAESLRLALAAGCTFLLAGTAVGLTLVPLSLQVWRGRYWSARRRLYYYALAVGAVAAAPLLLHYHLLGYWF